VGWSGGEGWRVGGGTGRSERDGEKEKRWGGKGMDGMKRLEWMNRD
jgi:hypothetical protein